MLLIRAGFGFFVLIMSFQLGQAAPVSHAAPLSAEVYGRLPAVEHVAISPDGTRLAMVTTKGNQRFVLIQPLDGKAPKSVPVGPAKLRGISWADNTYLLVRATKTVRRSDIEHYAQSNDKVEASALYSLNTRTMKSVHLLGGLPGIYGVFHGNNINVVHAQRPYALLTALNNNNYEFRYDLLKIDLETGKSPVDNINRQSFSQTGKVKPVVRGYGPHFHDWLVNSHGDPVARFTFNRDEGLVTILARPHTKADWKTLYQSEDQDDRWGLVGLTSDEKGVVMSGFDDNGLHQTFVAPLDGSKPYAPYGELGSSDPLVSVRTNTLYGLSITEHYQQHSYVIPELAAIHAKLKSAFRGQHVYLTSFDDEYRRVVAFVEGDQNAGTYYLFDNATNAASVISEQYPRITADHMAPTHYMPYTAQDGLEIPAYLTLPAGRQQKDLPLVVLPHGGPEARDTAEFDYWTQFLASRGYAVLRPNFRGSSGYGRDFTERGHGEWGRKMQTDLSDGVGHLVSQGLVDPDRVCIVGASYGGYAALAGVALQSGHYRCAVAVAGVTDLKAMLKWEEEYMADSENMTMRYFKTFMGVKSSDDHRLNTISPAQFANRVTVPVLLIHGRDDTVVPFQQSQLMYDAMKAAGKTVEMVTLDGEDHWLSLPQTRTEMLKATEAFLLKHNPPK